MHKYEIVRVIGRGGMGTVYEALNTAIGKRVAMKFIDAGTVQNAETAARFQREAEAASAVESAHIVEIFDSGISEEGQPYIVMELLRGEDLGHRIKRCGRVDLPEALHVTAQLLRGLHRAHKAGIVHRDLKPDNIFLVDRDDDPNFAKILDFGISKVRRGGETPVHTLTRQGTVLGTPFYMSPEQAQAQPDVDARSDLWSVGAILYECLTGRPPYSGATYEQVIVNICMNDAEDVRLYNPAVPEPVALVIAKALSRDREGRFQEAREFLEALRAAAGSSMSSGVGAASEDSFTGLSSSNPLLSPVSSARMPARSSGRRAASPTDDVAFDATVKFHSTPPVDDRGAPILSNEERRRLAKQRQRRTFAAVAISALLMGGVSAYVFARVFTRTAEAPIGSSAGTAPQPTASTAVTTSPSIAPADPVPTTTATASAAPPADTGEPKAKTSAKAMTSNVPVPSVRPSATAAVTAKPAETSVPAPPGSGVASGLKLKTD
ncbi:serine/threonine protein kinase [Minicystis rosea]|nr:serine/threonine protein kinase [Minicystis rosea]